MFYNIRYIIYLFKNRFKKNRKKMNVVLNYLILSGFMFGLVSALYLGLKTIKLI